MEWQPIETAPDDREILLFCGGKVTTGSWDLDIYRKNPKPHWRTIRGTVYGKLWEKDNQPTHWMPLPDPPKE